MTHEYKNEEIRDVITEWVAITGQTEACYLFHYLLGYYGEINFRMRDEVDKLVSEGVLTWEENK